MLYKWHFNYRYFWPLSHIPCEPDFSVDEIESCFVTRIYNNRNKQAFSQAIYEIDWLETCNASDTQKSFDLFHNKLILLHKFFFPKNNDQKKIHQQKTMAVGSTANID